MMPRMARCLVGIGFVLALSPAVSGAGEAASGGLTAHVRGDQRKDEIPAQVRRSLQASIAAYEQAGLALPAPKAAGLVYPFFPQGGIQGQDLFLLNFTDLDPTPGVRDWDCTGYTYDGHQGYDSGIRSFREQAIGVPIFAVLDGRVVDSHDGEPDMNTVWNNQPANYVVLDHGGGYYALYWHMKRGSVAVQRNQTVAAGTQIGLTGSSGISTGPHLHFESWKDGQWFEPATGRCHAGTSFWKTQPPVPRNFYVADAYLAKGMILIDSDLALLLDNVPRTSTFVAGRQRIGLRLDYHNLPGGSSWRLITLAPNGDRIIDVPGSWGNQILYRTGWGAFWIEADFTPGVWHYRLDINGTKAVDLPFTIVGNASQIVNHKPKAITVRLVPAAPVTGQIMTCQVKSPLVARDPDYDIVRYKYEWTVNKKVVRAVTSAALADVLAKGKSKSGDKVTCRVTPADDRVAGASALAVAE
jgi:murein DD-endopeptidase MepM/ murein hydrolase activator NlpD